MSDKYENINLKYSGVKEEKKLAWDSTPEELYRTISINRFEHKDFCVFPSSRYISKIWNNVLCIDCYRSMTKIWHAQDFLQKLTSCGIYYYVDVAKQPKKKRLAPKTLSFIDMQQKRWYLL